MPLLPVRKCSASVARSVSLPISAALTKRCMPLSTLVTTIAARRAARSALSAVRMSSFMICPDDGRRTTEDGGYKRIRLRVSSAVCLPSSFICRQCYSTFSTNTRIVPPHDNPTCQAVSSATPNSSILDLPVSITSSASVTTAPSTQPPDTEPRKLPSPSMTRFEPTGRGAEPQVSTTVASATSRPALRQSSAALRMSLSVVSIVNSPKRLWLESLELEYRGSRYFLQPRSRIARGAGSILQ